MTTLHEDIKKKKQYIDYLKQQANQIAIQRVRVETELAQHRKIEEDYIRQMNELGYANLEELEKAIGQKQDLLSSIISKLDRMVAGEIVEEKEEVDLSFDIEEDDDFEF